MSDKVRFLNKEVEKEVLTEGPAFYAAWCLSYGEYDWDIDPLFNPDYVRSARQKEVDQLNALRVKFQGLLKEFHQEASRLEASRDGH